MERRSIHGAGVSITKTPPHARLSALDFHFLAFPPTTDAPTGAGMPASRADLEQLRSIERYLRSPHRAGDPLVERTAIDALTRAISLLDETLGPNNPVWWCLGALKTSMRKVNDGLFVVTDRDLQSWALRQIWELTHHIPEGDGSPQE